MFKIVQLSDIHFLPDADVDVNAELSEAVLAFAGQIRAQHGEVDLIVVSGDIAYAGLKEEYARASTFLRNLEVRLGQPRILVIPGNHDIIRSLTTSGDQIVLRVTPRQESMKVSERDKALAATLKDGVKGPQLLEPLSDYLEFADEFDCVFDTEKPFWEVKMPLTSEVEAHFRGLTSVLLSDAHDNDLHLFLGRMQTSSIKLANEPGVFNVTICHHEFDWLLDGDEQKDVLDHRSGLHISGHDHHQRLRKTDGGLHLHSGAMQPDRTEDEWEPRVNLITLDTSVANTQAETRIEVHEARFEPSADSFVWEMGPPRPFYARTEIKGVALPPAQRKAEVAHLHRRLANLSPSDRFEAARETKLDLRGLGSVGPSAIVAAMINDAEDRDLLRRLWDRVEYRHGNQSGDGNPF